MKDYLFKNKKSLVYAVILFILVFVGFYIRFIELGKASLSYTEPISMYAAKSILETGKSTLLSREDYSRSQLFTNLVALSFKFFGLNEFAARFPSVIFGTLSIILIFFIGKSFFGTVSGLIAAFMVALIPFEVVWSRECRMYAMLQFFFLFGFFAFYKYQLVLIVFQAGFVNQILRFGVEREILFTVIYAIDKIPYHLRQ